MSCPYGVGDTVGIPAAGGICGVVERREPLGSGWQLWVRLPNGNTISVSCASVGPCLQPLDQAEKGNLCGELLPTGGTCRRVVRGGGRCYLHRN